MTSISNEKGFDCKNTIDYIAQITNSKLEEIPNWQTIQDVIECLDIDEIRNIRKYMVKAIIKSKMFNKYKYEDGWQLLVDATGLSSHDYNLNGTCTSRKSKNGTEKFYKYVLEAKLVCKNMVFSVDSEWIENSNIKTEKDKQDCETTAFYRMAKRIKKEYPHMEFIITGDALYATEPVMQICKENHWKFILNLKEKRLKNVFSDFEDNLSYENETNKKDYFLSTNIEYKGFKLNAVRYQEMQKDNKTKEMKQVVFNYITNLHVDNFNIKDIVALGRRRWKIENEGFNCQKNGTFCISHLCSRNENAIKVHYYLIQIAHIIRQLLENGSKVLKSMLFKTKKEISENLYDTLTKQHTNLNNLNLAFQLRFDD